MAASASVCTTPTSTPKWGQAASPSAATPSSIAATSPVPKTVPAESPARGNSHFSGSESLTKRGGSSVEDVALSPGASSIDLRKEVDPSLVSTSQPVRIGTMDKRSSCARGDKASASKPKQEDTTKLGTGDSAKAEQGKTLDISSLPRIDQSNRQPTAGPEDGTGVWKAQLIGK